MIRKILNFIWVLLGAVAIFFASIAILLAWPIIVWLPRKDEKKTIFDWLFNPFAFQKKFGHRIYWMVIVVVTLILILGLHLFFTYTK